MDNATLIIDELVSICESLGYRVELDRVFPVQESQIPLIVVRTGEEELEEGSNLLTFDSLWTVRPSVEHYIVGSDTSTVRAELNSFWSQFRTAFKQSAIVSQPLIRENSLPSYSRTVISPSSNPKIAGQFLNFELPIRR